MSVNYLPFGERTLDKQYGKLLQRIMSEGEDIDCQQEERAKQVIQHTMQFDLKNGFPVITERDLVSPDPDTGKGSMFYAALAEHIAFLHGTHTQEELKSFGVSWWSRWVTPEKCEKRGLPTGDLGPGSYGPALRAFPTAEGEPFDQLATMLQQMRENPRLRTHFISPIIPQYIFRVTGRQQKVVVVPCHFIVHVFLNHEKKTLSLHHFQRSADAPVGLPFNIIQYAALTLMLAQVLGYEAKKLYYTISSADIFEGQMDDVREMLETDPGVFPTVTLDPTITDLFDFRPEHFTVTDYHPKGGRRKIWTPV